jgi:hypothetical protein
MQCAPEQFLLFGRREYGVLCVSLASPPVTPGTQQVGSDTEGFIGCASPNRKLKLFAL